MATITLTSYNPITGCLAFTISGAVLSTVYVQKSIDNGISWTEFDGSPVSPRCGYIVTQTTKFRLRLPTGEFSNIITHTIVPPVVSIILTPVTKITFANSPVHLRIQNSALDNTIRACKVKLWIWSGAQNAVLGNPTATYLKSIVSINDDYINLEVSDVIKSYLEKPNNTTSVNQPAFGYNVNALPAVSGQGVFWQIQTEVTSVAGTEILNYPTQFATLGWLWDYEQNGLSNNANIQYGSLGFPKSVVKWFNPNVPKYFKQSFVLNQDTATCTSSNMVLMEVEAKTKTRCTRDSSLIVYLDKRGLWDVFTPHGKILITDKVESQTSKRIFRDPSKVNNTIAHSKSRNSLNVDQTYLMNTGTIDESDVQRVEELIYSPKVYLIRFLGDIVYEVLGGLTIDSTFVTIDNTNITIDNTPVVPLQVPYFATFKQIPVIVDETDFTRKTLINDRNQIDYNIKLVGTTNKLNDIR